MTKKIIRGAIAGGFLGLAFGLILSYVIYFTKKTQGTNVDKLLESTYTSVFGGEDSIVPDSAKGGGELNFNPPECDDLEDVILRFHVKANSNSDEDIALKYMVRDAVLTEIGGDLKGDLTRDEVLSYIKEHLNEIGDIAETTIATAGYSYGVDVYIANDYFPIRQYGELVLPAGNYQALRIDIGAAEGENFWCILYPMMCYTVDSGAVISHSDEERLQEELSQEDFEKLFVHQDTEDNEVKVKFKLLELLGL